MKRLSLKNCGPGLGLSLMAWNRANINDIIQSLDCGVDAVAISISTSDIHIKHKLRSTREQHRKIWSKLLNLPKTWGLYICKCRGSSRTDFEFLVKFALATKESRSRQAALLRYSRNIRDPLRPMRLSLS